MRWSRFLAAVIASALGLVPLVATGAAAKTTPAGGWTRTVCKGLDRWQVAVTDAFDELDDQDGSDASAAQEALLGTVKGMSKATAQLRKRLAKAGTPDVDGGEDFTATLSGGFADVSAAVKTARAEIGGASTDDAAGFQLVATAAINDLATALESTGTAFAEADALDNADLLDALNAEKACAGLIE